MKDSKILILFVFVIAIFTYCIFAMHIGKENKIMQEKAENALIIKQDSIRQDSIKCAHDSILLLEGNKVIGDIYYGMNKKNFSKAMKKLVESLKNSEGQAKIGDFAFVYKDYKSDKKDWDISTRYEQYSTHCTGIFKMDSLFHVTIQGEEYPIYRHYDGEYIDSNDLINSAISSLVKFLTQKYGKPQQKQSPYAEEWRTKKTGYVYSIAKWDIGYKQIEIYVRVVNPRISSFDIDYAQVVLAFTNKNMVSEINDRADTQKKMQETIKRDREEKERIENKKKLESL